MDISTKIKLAMAYAGIKEAELARRLGTSPQAFGQRMKNGLFSVAELEKIAVALGAEYNNFFQFSDGQQI